MKGSENFTAAIVAHLQTLAGQSAEFALKYSNSSKTIDECCKYILGEVKASGRQGFADAEIYGMAVHYYEEENVEVGDSSGCSEVIVNREIQLTEEEIAEAKREALERITNKEVKAKTAKPSTTKSDITVTQTSLF